MNSVLRLGVDELYIPFGPNLFYHLQLIISGAICNVNLLSKKIYNECFIIDWMSFQIN